MHYVKLVQGKVEQAGEVADEAVRNLPAHTRLYDTAGNELSWHYNFLAHIMDENGTNEAVFAEHGEAFAIAVTAERARALAEAALATEH